MKEVFTRQYWDFWNITKVVLLVFCAVFLLYPLFTLLRGSFINAETGSRGLSNYFAFFSNAKYLDTFINSLIISVVTTISGIMLGFPLAYLMTRHNIRGANVLKVVLLITLMSPPFIGAYSWILILGNNGVVRQAFEAIGIELFPIYGMGGILLVFALKLFPFIFFYVSGALRKIDASLEEAAEGLGMHKLKGIWSVTIPLILPTMLSGGLLVFMTALADFGTPFLLGRGVKTLPVIIYDEFVSELGGNAYFASAIGVVIILFIMIIFFSQQYVINKKSFVMSSIRPVLSKDIKGINGVFAHLYCYILVFLAAIPQIVVTFTSFKNISGSVFKEGFTFSNYIRTFDKLSLEIVNTFVYSTIAISIVILISLLVAYLTVRRQGFSNKLLDNFIMLPYIIPGTIIGLIYVMSFNSGLLILTGTPAILIIVYAIRRMSSAVRSSVSILYQISPNVEEASISLGVSPIKSFFKITAILMLPGVISGALLAWVRIISELSASIMLYTGSTKTMPVAIYSEIIYGRFGTASVMSTVLVLSTVVVLVLFLKLSGKKEISL